MNPQTIVVAAEFVSGLTELGVEIVGGVRAVVSLLHPGATDAELDADVDAITAEAARRQAERESMLPPADPQS